MPTLEYHNENWTWTDMLMEVKKDYKNAIIHQVCYSEWHSVSIVPLMKSRY